MQSASSNAQPFVLTIPQESTPDYYKIGQNGEKIAITRGEYKDAMRKQFTVRRPSVPACGHRFAHSSEPRHSNCESCWFAFFQVHGELTQACDEVFKKFGEAGLRQLRGPKFTKNYLRFMSTLAQWKAAADAAEAASKEANGTERTGGTGIGSGEVNPGNGAEPVIIEPGTAVIGEHADYYSDIKRVELNSEAIV